MKRMRRARVLVARVAVLAAVLAGGPAQAKVQTDISNVQAVHLKVSYLGTPTYEVWLQRPGRLRVVAVRAAGHRPSLLICNAESMWSVDEAKHTATQAHSWYLDQARNHGQDVVAYVWDELVLRQIGDALEKGHPQASEESGANTDAYHVSAGEWKGGDPFDALVDHDTGRLISFRISSSNPAASHPSYGVEVLGYDEHLADGLFTFDPPQGMELTRHNLTGEGATLSGRVIWADSGAPVADASVSAGSNPPVLWLVPRTNKDGRWVQTGLAAGRVVILPQRWSGGWVTVPDFDKNVGTLQQPTVIVDGKSRYDGLDFSIRPAAEVCARLTIHVKDEDGKPVGGVMGVCSSPGYGMWLQDDASSPGLLENDEVWPSDEPIRVRVYQSAPDSPYPQWAATTEPFMPQARKAYEFTVVLPFQREADVTVTDTDGRALSGIDVRAFGFDGYEWRPTSMPRRPGQDMQSTTGPNGKVRIGQLAPDRDVTICAARMVSRGAGQQVRAASACVTYHVPPGREPSQVPIVLDPRPTRIEGTFESPPGSPPEGIYCVGPWQWGEWAAEPKGGAFVLMGVPAGQITFGAYSLEQRWRPKRRAFDGAVTVAPGHAYVVKVAGTQVTLVSTRPLE